jgi:hypothetical protein
VPRRTFGEIVKALTEKLTIKSARTSPWDRLSVRRHRSHGDAGAGTPDGQALCCDSSARYAVGSQRDEGGPLTAMSTSGDVAVFLSRLAEAPVPCQTRATRRRGSRPGRSLAMATPFPTPRQEPISTLRKAARRLVRLQAFLDPGTLRVTEGCFEGRLIVGSASGGLRWHFAPGPNQAPSGDVRSPRFHNHSPANCRRYPPFGHARRCKERPTYGPAK